MTTTVPPTPTMAAPEWAEFEAACAEVFAPDRRPTPFEAAVLADADEELERLEARIDDVLADAAHALRRSLAGHPLTAGR